MAHEEGVDLRPCVGCGAPVPAVAGPPARWYLDASPGCWAVVYGEVLAREYGEFGYPPIHRLTVDAYSAQHPGPPTSRQSIRSVAVHLIGLHLVLERGYGPDEATDGLRRALARHPSFAPLDPPSSLGQITVLHVRGARDLAEHTERVERWAKSVWEAWAPHHETVRRWTDR